MFFQARKVKFETLPEYLRAVRQNLNLSIEQVAGQTGVSTSALKALEAGAYTVLPPEVYTKGFLSQLAGLYRIDKQLIIRQFNIEKKIQQNLAGLEPKRQSAKKSFWEDLVVTPKLLSLAVGLIFVAVMAVYIVWQVTNLSRVPKLEIEGPQNYSATDKSSLEIKGWTDSSATLTINGQPVFVDAQGRFSTVLSISSGPKEFFIEAKNRFNKSTLKTLTIIGQAQNASERQNGVILELEFLQAVEIALQVGDEQKTAQVFQKGDRKSVLAKARILFSTSNAAAVAAKVNGKNLGVLGREGEVLVDIPFFPESGNMK